MLNTILDFDWKILDLIQGMRCEFLDRIMMFLTSLGNYGAIWIFIGVLFLFFKKTRKTGIAMAFALLAVLILGNMVLKPLIARLRPFMTDETIMLLIKAPEDFSFPSGHTYSAIAAATAILRYHRKSGIFALAGALLIGFSRMYLMVHFPTDILGGIVLGVICGIIGIFITEKIYKSANKPKDVRE